MKENEESKRRGDSKRDVPRGARQKYSGDSKTSKEESKKKDKSSFFLFFLFTGEVRLSLRKHSYF